MSAAPLVRLVDGREVSTSSEERRAECLRRHEQVTALLGMPKRAERVAYLQRIEAAEGIEARRRVEARLKVAWGEPRVRA